MKDQPTKKVLKLSIGPDGAVIREYVTPESPANDRQRSARRAGIEGGSMAGSRAQFGQPHLPGDPSMNCHQFKRLITSAVDGRLEGDERIAFDRHARECSSCRDSYELEASVKATVRRHVPLVKTPKGLRDAIMRDLHAMDEATLAPPEPAPPPSRLRRFLRAPLWKPAAIVLLASAAILLLVVLRNEGSPGGLADDKNLLVRSLLTHRALQAGELSTQITSDNPGRVKAYLSQQTDIPVTIPSLKGFTLVGGLADEYHGLHVAHVVYRQGSTILTMVEVPLQDILRNNGLGLPLNARNGLLHTGRFVDTRDGDSIMLWTQGTTLCAAVAHMDPGKLRGMMGDVEGVSSGDQTW